MLEFEFNNNKYDINYNSNNNVIYESKLLAPKYYLDRLELQDKNNTLKLFDNTYSFNILPEVSLIKINNHLDNITSKTYKLNNYIYISTRNNCRNKKEITFICYIFPKKNSKEFLKSLCKPINKIDDKIFIGNLLSAIDYNIIKNNNIKNIVHIFEEELDNYKLNFMNILINDNINEDISKYFDKFIKFINDSKGNVLIHCQHGSSRSGSFVILYLMYKYKINFNNALFFAKYKRNGIYPNKNFINQLKKIDKNKVFIYL